MATQTVVYTGFADGEYGTLSPFNVGYRTLRGHLLYAGWWTGQNIMRGLNGTLFPRAGEKPYILTGVPNGVIDGMGFASAGGNPYIWFAVGTTVYRFRADVFASQAVTAYTGSFTAFTEPLSWVDHSGVSYVFAYPNGLYKLDHGATTVAAIAGSPAAYECCIYGDRLMAASVSTLYYSAAADFETWPVDGQIQVGDVFNILSLDTVRGRLAIGKDGLFGEPWFVLSGIPGFNDVLRQVEVSMVPPHPEAAVDMGQGVGLVTSDEGTLAVFDGSHLHPIPHLQVVTGSTAGVPSEMSAFRLRRPGEWGVVVNPSVDNQNHTAGSIWIFRNGAWTYHKRTPASTESGTYAVSVGYLSKVVFGRGGDTGTPATFAAYNPYLDRPPFVSDTATILDPADCFFTLPEWWARDASLVAVKSVTVDFLTWNSTDTVHPNTFTPNVVAMRTYDPTPDRAGGGGADRTVTPNRTYSEPTTDLPFTGVGQRRRMVFKYDATWGNGFRLEFTNMRGVSIEKIVAEMDTKADPT